MIDCWKVENRIACDDCGYPQSEALYPDKAAWLKDQKLIKELMSGNNTSYDQ